MADRYWVGGSGNWSDTNRWSDTSGGTPGASVPTSIDSVIFDANSNVGTGSFTVTVDGTSSVPSICNDFSTGGSGGALDGAMTLSMGATAFLECYGSMTLPASNLTWTGTSGAILAFKANTTGKTFTTNGVLISNVRVYFDGVGGEWTLGSALTLNLNSVFSLNLINGSFNTGNFNITAVAMTIGNGNICAFNAGSSTITLSGSGPLTVNTTNLTFNAGTSTIICSSIGPTFSGSGLTFYNVTFSNGGAGTVAITGANTFNNLTFTSRSATGLRFVSLAENQTVSGTLTFGTANTSIRRISVSSSIIGTQRTITAATVAAIADVDFRDIKAAGASAPWSGTRIGNCQGNDATSITFTAGAPKYWNLAAGGSWSATAWALGSGGAVDANNFPLAQDSVIIENTGLNASATITVDQGWNIPALSFATRTLAMTFATGTTTPFLYGDLTLDADVTYTGTGNITFAEQAAPQLITSAGKTLTQPLTFNTGFGTVRLVDNLTIGSTLTTTLTAGTLDLVDKTLSTGLFNTNNSNVRTLAFGTGNITVTGNNATVLTMNGTNFTYTGTPNINATYAGSTGTRTFSFTTGGTEANALNINITAGSDIVNLPFRSKNVDFTGFSGSSLNASNRFIFGNLTISAGMTFTSGIGVLTFGATSGTQQITTNSVVIDNPLSFNGIGGTFAFQDALTQGATQAFTITNGTVQLKNGVTSTVGAFATSGTNQKFLRSTLAGSQATLRQASGTVDASYLTIQDINATGGATWNAYVNQFNSDAGNVDGWDFGISPVVGGAEYTYSMRSFTQPRRF